MACSHQILHQNELGYTLKCECRNQLQLCFNNNLLQFEKESFHNFCNYVEHLYEQRENVLSMYPQDIRHIYMETPNKDMWLCFSVRELKLMYELLVQTLAMIEVKRFMYNDLIFGE